MPSHKQCKESIFLFAIISKKYEKQSILIFVLFVYVVAILWTLKWVQSELRGCFITLFVSNALR